MKNRVLSEFWHAVKQGPRLYFAPIVGAIKEMRKVGDEIYAENRARWEAQAAEDEKAKNNN